MLRAYYLKITIETSFNPSSRLIPSFSVRNQNVHPHGEVVRARRIS